MRVQIIVLLATAACAPSVRTAELCLEKRELVEFGTLVREPAQVTANSPLRLVEREGARHIRLRLHAKAPGTCSWRLMIRDERFRPVQILRAADLPPGRSIWSARIFGSKAWLDLLDCSPGPGGPDIRADEHIWLPKGLGNPQYSIKARNGIADWKPLGLSGAPAARMRQGDAVGMLVGVTASRAANWTCSGVVIADDLFLTNWHCIEPLPDRAPETMQGLIVDMSWDGDSAGQDMQVLAFEHGTPDLDFAILKVVPLSRDMAPRIAALRTQAPVQDEVALIHHPQGQEKMLSSSGCRIADLNYPTEDAPVVSHTCDTAGGSSGAPVFDRDGRITALHFCGFNEAQDAHRFNRAVRIDAILKWLRDRKARGDTKAAEIFAKLRFE